MRTEGSYQEWVLRLCGILGNPVAGRKAALAQKAAGGKRRPEYELYGYRRAYTNNPVEADLALLNRVLVGHWGEVPKVLDPTAGGGSIPFAAIRLGLTAYANDLNQVASVLLRAGIEVPVQFGAGLLPEVDRFGKRLVERVEARLAPFYERKDRSESIMGYLIARTVKCPRTGFDVPLTPNWWLHSDKNKPVSSRAAVQPTYDLDNGSIQFEVLVGRAAADCRADVGTVARGGAISPWDEMPIRGDYIKAEAAGGRMGHILYAVCATSPFSSGRYFRPPSAVDQKALDEAAEEWARWRDSATRDGLVPDESIPPGNDKRPQQYGMLNWVDMFSPRQLLAHATFLDELRKTRSEITQEIADQEKADAISGLVALSLGTALNVNSLLASWDASTPKVRSVFDRHDFSFKWSYAEYDASKNLYSWSLGQVQDALTKIVGLIPKGHGQVTVSRGTAGDLDSIESDTMTLVCVDPPYYDNVMYAELSDYFGVWEQHAVGKSWPDLMPGGPADTKNEAVSNVARFEDAGRKKKLLADADYQAKMQAIFAECYRVLRYDGVLTVMFTHKRAEAWDTLGMALMEAGFTIETSWPVNTEPDQSLHQAKKNAAASTIMLVCRRREEDTEDHPYFEDLEAQVRQAAKEAVRRFSSAGISGVDLLLSTYGPALSVISSHWPVYSSEADESGKSRLLRPEEALDAAREEVVRMQRLALIGRQVELDPLTDFVLLAWSTFRAETFPFDEARRLALAVGSVEVGDLESDKILTSSSGTVTLCRPEQRLRRRGDDKPGVRPAAEAFAGPVIDAVHTVLYVAEQDGLANAKALIDRTGLAGDNRFTACIQGLVRAIPRTKQKGKWVRPEAGLLDGLAAAYFPDIEVPEDWTGRLDLGV